MNSNLGDNIKSRRIALNMTQDELAAKIGVSQATIEKLENKKQKKTSYLLEIAEALETSPSKLSGTPLNYDSSNLVGLHLSNEVPLLTWKIISYKNSDLYKLIRNKSADKICAPIEITEDVFALKIENDFMTSKYLNESFEEDEIILLDPNKNYEHGSFVLARNKQDGNCIFRKFIKDGNLSYLKPLNEQYSAEKSDNYDILGVCISAFKLRIMNK